MSAIERAIDAPAAHGGQAAPAARVRRGQISDRSALALAGQRALRFLSPVLLLLGWELMSLLGLLDRRFFPPPTEILSSAVRMWETASITDATLVSLRRLALGYGIGASAGIAIGLWLGLSRWSRALIEPWLLVTYPIPKLAIYPLIVLVVGLGEMPIIIMLAIAVFYIVAINTTAGVLAIRPVINDVGKDYGANFLQRAATIALPASLPYIFTGLEVALGIAYIVLIAAEFVGARTGLGSIIWTSWQTFDVAPMYVAIFTISFVGYLSTLAVRYARTLIAPWAEAR